jgi:hypothetical protein
LGKKVAWRRCFWAIAMIASRINSRLSAAERHGAWLMAISNWPPPDSQCIWQMYPKTSNQLSVQSWKSDDHFECTERIQGKGLYKYSDRLQRGVNSSYTCSMPISKASNTLLISDMMDAEASKPADEQYGVVSTPSHLFGLPSTEESVYDTCRMNLRGEITKMVCIQSTVEHPCFPLLSDLRYDI